jgi:hypothetical protein
VPIQTISLDQLPDKWKKGKEILGHEYAETVKDLGIDLNRQNDRDGRTKLIEDKKYISLTSLEYRIENRTEHLIMKDGKET